MEFKKFEKFLQNRSFEQGEALEAEALIVAQKILVNSGADFIPKSYVEFLRRYNGFKSDRVYFFGATVDDDLDIVDRNEDTPKPKNSIVLGYNDTDLLCFDFTEKKYQIADRDTLQIVETFAENDLDAALQEICYG